MKMKKIFTLISIIGVCSASAQTFSNPMRIPYTMSGTSFNLRIHDTVSQFYAGHNTNTLSYNSMTYLGPTLILQQGDNVSFNITNEMADTTTVHWHGMHVPAMWDGGPMNIIAPGQTWMPQYTVMNNAATCWYHSHMHMKTLEQVTMGLAGMIIVKDPIEAALNLPRTYGTDDFPIVLQDRDIDGGYNLHDPPLGSLMMINGTVDPYLSCPAQVVRYRLLNGSNERSYMFGFSDNRNFSVIGIDQGLLEAPVVKSKIRISPGERIEILVDFSADQGNSVYMMNYGTQLGLGVSGGFTHGPGGGTGPLDSTDVQMMKVVVGAPTASPVLSIPSSLVAIDYIDTMMVSRTRTKLITSPLFPGGPYTIDNTNYDMNVINDTVLLGATEIWEMTNHSQLMHPMHIHDVFFHIISRNGVPVQAHEKGLKDVVDVEVGETVRVVTQFLDFADPMYAYMFHCHILEHEDMGMMQQFIVIDSTGMGGMGLKEYANRKLRLFPNPASDRLKIDLLTAKNFEVSISDISGKVVAMYTNQKEIPVSTLAAGLYFIRVSDERGTIVEKFVRE
jgi:bilirubin oxidase